ncbi:MAG: amidohydrolase family protein [Kiritimatiellae bacterium]|nr:amidohydrolase family protein [Kiritimatiellia bacterium]
MIIDAHGHYGYDYVFHCEFTLESHLKKMEKHGVNITILQPGETHYLEDAKREHDAIFRAVKEHPGRFYGMANPAPHLRDADYNDEIKRCVQELGFVGIKLNTCASATGPGSKDGRRVFEQAAAHNIPVMVHTGAGPFAHPCMLAGVARQYPAVKIVMAHAGGNTHGCEVPLVMDLCPNVYVESSGGAAETLRQACRRDEGRRVMFGCDHAGRFESERAKIVGFKLGDAVTQRVLGQTAKDVFALA